MIFRQFFDTISSTYTYLISSGHGREALIIDPVLEKTDQYIQEVIKADFKEAGDEDVFKKVKSDLKDKNIDDNEIRLKMKELNEKAKSDFM